MRFIALTGYCSADHREKALASGFDVHLAKPLGKHSRAPPGEQAHADLLCFSMSCSFPAFADMRAGTSAGRAAVVRLPSWHSDFVRTLVRDEMSIELPEFSKCSDRPTGILILGHERLQLIPVGKGEIAVAFILRCEDRGARWMRAFGSTGNRLVRIADNKQ